MITIKDVSIIPGYPTVIDKRRETIIIADLHLGYEEEAAEQGFFLPKLQYKKAVQLIEELHDMTKAKRLVINGDIKNSFNRLTIQEREETIKFLAKSKELFEEVILVRGNHDNYMPIITERLDIPFLEEYELTPTTLIVHGHKIIEKLSSYELIIIGHEHPAFTLKDELGSITKMPCFLRIPTTIGNEILVLPAAGYYQTGNPISSKKDDYLSPIVKEYGIIEEAAPIVFDTEKKDVFEFPSLNKIAEVTREPIF